MTKIPWRQPTPAGHVRLHPGSRPARRATLIMAGIILSALLPWQTCQAEPVETYYPLKAGMTWEYSLHSSKAGAGKIIVKNLPERELDGKKVTPREWDAAGNIKYYLIAKDSFGIYRYAEQQSTAAAPVVITPKVYYLKEPVDRGTTWDIVTKLGDRQLKVNLTVESINDTITVPAGTFKDCVKIKHEGGMPPGDHKSALSLSAYEWYAPGVGLVKSLATLKEGSKASESAETLTYQLESFKP